MSLIKKSDVKDHLFTGRPSLSVRTHPARSEN
jgi:hypothetical protein